MKEDISSQVMISLRASEAWQRRAEQKLRSIPADDLANAELAIEDEIIWIREDDILVIEASVMGDRVTLMVPTNEWRWVS